MGAGAVQDAAVRRGAALFNGLGDKSRLAIVLVLSGGEKRVTDLVELLDWPKAPSPGTWPACATAA